jgi:hypothetical protein
MTTRYRWTSACGVLMTSVDIAAEKRRRSALFRAGYWRSIKHHILQITSRTNASKAAEMGVLLIVGLPLITQQLT